MPNLLLDPQEVTYANMVILKLSDGKRIAAGIELCKRSWTEDGRTIHTPYKVMSMMYAGLKTPTIRQAIPTICCDILREVERGTKLVNFRSGSPHFQRYRSLEATVGLFAMQRGIDVRFNHKHNFHIRVSDLAKLCEDAIRRGNSLISAVQKPRGKTVWVKHGPEEQVRGKSSSGSNHSRITREKQR